jgi:hypothetical protein
MNGVLIYAFIQLDIYNSITNFANILVCSLQQFLIV